MSYLRYLCLFAYSGVFFVVVVFVFFFIFVLCLAYPMFSIFCIAPSILFNVSRDHDIQVTIRRV